MNTNNLDRVENRKLKILLLFLGLFLIYSCGVRSNKWKKKILSESVKVSSYEVNSTKIEEMMQTLLDTCFSRYQCEEIDFVRLKVDVKNDSARYWLMNGGNLFGYENSKAKLAVFRIMNTIILTEKESIETLNLFSLATFEEEIILSNLLSPEFNGCLYLRKGKDYKKNLISMSFSEIKNEPIQFESFITFVE